MPKIVRSRHWTIRIDLIPGVLERLPEYCAKTSALICCQESGEGDSETGNEHIHILSSFTDVVARPDLTAAMKSHFKDSVFAKSDFAFTVWETYGQDTAMEEYICKGPSKVSKTPPKVLFKSWLDDPMKHHEAWWAKHETIMTKSKAKLEKAQKTDAQRLAVVEKIHSEIVCWKADYETLANRQPDQDEIIEHAEKLVLRAYSAKVNDHVAFPVLQAVLYKHIPKIVERAFHDRMKDKFKYLY